MQKGFAAVLGSLIERLVSRFGKAIPSIAGLDHLHASSVRNRLEEGEGRPDLRVPRRRERRAGREAGPLAGPTQGDRARAAWPAAGLRPLAQAEVSGVHFFFSFLFFFSKVFSK